MFNANQIISAFSGLVSFSQNDDPNGVKISAGSPLLTSSSGLLFNQQHPLLNINAIAALAPAFHDFAEGNDSDTRFTAWLKQEVDQATVQVVTDWLTQKTNLKTASNLLMRERLIDVTYEDAEYDLPGVNVVGLELRLPRSSSLVAKLKSLEVQFSQAQELTINLWSSDKRSGPVDTIQIDYTTPGDVMLADLSWSITPGKVWYVCYDQAQITGVSYNAFSDRSMIKFPRFAAGRYLSVQPFAGGLPASASNDTIEREVTNYGLNLRATVECDYTELIIEQKALFADAVAKGVAAKLLHNFIHNSSARVNRHQAGVDTATLLYELNGEATGRPSGLAHSYDAALKAIRFDQTNIDGVCLPCKRRGINIAGI